jgi:hypothetical protein
LFQPDIVFGRRLPEYPPNPVLSRQTLAVGCPTVVFLRDKGVFGATTGEIKDNRIIRKLLLKIRCRQALLGKLYADKGYISSSYVRLYVNPPLESLNFLHLLRNLHLIVYLCGLISIYKTSFEDI